MLLTLPDVPLRTASFSLEDRYLLWSRARLYADRLTLHGIGLWQQFWRDIPLSEIERIDRDGQLLVVRVRDEQQISFLLNEPKQWKTAIQMNQKVYDD